MDAHRYAGPPSHAHLTAATANTASSSTSTANSTAASTPSAYDSPSIATRAASLAISSHPPHAPMDFLAGDVDGDMPMEDADPYNKQKYARAPSNRLSAHHLPHPHADEPQSASRTASRYSPMNTSPTSPYGPAPAASDHQHQLQHQHQQHQQHQHQQSLGSNHFTSYTPQQSSRQSPSRHGSYTSPTQSRYHGSPPSSSSRGQATQLPPLQGAGMSPVGYFPQSATQQLNAVFGHDVQSPQHLATPHSASGTPNNAVPRFTSCHATTELKPRINSQPPFRRANPEGGFISPLQALTTHLPATYRICNPTFQYESSRNPRRVLTKPSKGVKNDGYDNEESDYILYVNDILGSEETNHKNRYLILDVLGQGTFGQVVKCQNLKTQEVVAVKVVKNKTAYFNQSMMEVSVLDLLNGRMDKNDDHHILRLKDTFIHRQHLCLVFELLSVNLYELIKQNQFRGLSTTLVRVFAQQLLNALCLLSKAKLIHCDLKPENILLKNLESPIIKIIDFGSACDERQTVYTYIQSRFYRSPEVLLGLPYSAAIDMWSLGCIVVELFLGLPLFPGSSEYNQVSRITEMLGLPPTWMLEVGKQSGEFFEKVHDTFGRRTYRLKSMEQYSREHGTKEQPSKKYFTATRLPDIVRNYPMPRKNMKQSEVEREMGNREAFIDFVHGLLNINPLERWSPQQARTHPFITQQKFTGPFQPQMNLKTTSRSPAPGVQKQQHAEAVSKQRAQQQQQQHAQQAANVAFAGMHMNPGYPTSPQGAQQQHQQAAAAAAMYQQPLNTTLPAGAPPPYPSQPSSATAQTYQTAPLMPMVPQPPAAAYSSTGLPQAPAIYTTNPSTTSRSGSGTTNPPAGSTTSSSGSMTTRQRASTMDPQNGIPAALQRVVSHLDPNAPIRLQPSPAYFPPPPDGSDPNASGGPASMTQIGRRRTSRAHPNQLAQGGQGSNGGNGMGNSQGRNFVRVLEDRTLEEGWSGNGGGWPGA